MAIAMAEVTFVSTILPSPNLNLAGFRSTVNETEIPVE